HTSPTGALPPPRWGAAPRAANQFKGGALTVLGVLMTAGGFWLVRGDRGADPDLPVTDRAELGRREGWSFTTVDTDLLSTWRDNPHFGTSPAAWNVLRGTHEGFAFVVFDYRRYSGGANTAWMLFHPRPSPEFVAWAAKQGGLNRKPLAWVLTSDERAVVNVANRVHRSTKPDQVLRHVTVMAEIVRRFERSTIPAAE
ncbi:hypothetical protein, partial [Actinoplanes sp. NPDC051851]|uniref:hypothetical protein n=1 Tax=Actinoplanes sp. NPDC051851 TaxID=3154753 RepID=UPI003416D5C3